MISQHRLECEVLKPKLFTAFWTSSFVTRGDDLLEDRATAFAAE
jgi:hypothetical protein